MAYGSGDRADVGDVGHLDEVVAHVVVQPHGAGAAPSGGDQLAVEPASVAEAHVDLVTFEVP
jgi:hypothetical protein